MLSCAFNEARKQQKKPNWITDSIWESLLAHWSNPDFQKLQVQNKNNRAVNPGASLHCGGSISMMEHALRYVSKTSYTFFLLCIGVLSCLTLLNIF